MNKKETSNADCLQRLVRRLYDARLQHQSAKKALIAQATAVGRCEMHSENGMPCYLSPDLPSQEWCEVCRCKKPFWENYHKAANMAGAALRAVLKHAQTLPPNEKADLPPTGVRQPRSGTEGGNGG